MQLRQQKHQRRPPPIMVIVAKYELIENPARGVFCKELGAEFLSVL